MPFPPSPHRKPTAPAAHTAALVLGASLRPDGRPSVALRRRVVHAVRLLRRGEVDVLVLSGGGSPPEAEAMAALARSLGARPERLRLEPRARNTRENVTLARALLHDVATVVVVTDGYHLPRALWLARLGLSAVRVRGAASSGPGRGAAWWVGALREVPALAADLVRGLALLRR